MACIPRLAKSYRYMRQIILTHIVACARTRSRCSWLSDSVKALPEIAAPAVSNRA